jgi:hypothetical protein
VSGLVLLMGLLVLSYAGSLLVSARPGRAVGLASGTELVVLGVVLGPEVLGMIGPDTLSALGPIAHVALGWLGLILGASAGSLRGVPASERAGLGRGFLLAVATMLAVSAPVLGLLLAFPKQIALRDAVVAALACGVVAAAVLRDPRARVADEPEHARADARGSGGDLACALAMVVLASFTARPGGPAIAWAYAAAGPLVGALLGAIAALLLGKAPRDDAAWGVLLGVALLATGIAARLWLHALVVSFAIGAVLALASPARAQIRALIAPSERAVQLPSLVLAGASLLPRPIASESGAAGTRLVIAVVVVAIAARLAARWWPARRAPAGEARGALLGAPPLGVFLGLSLLIADPARGDGHEGGRAIVALPLLVAATIGLAAEIARARARLAAGSIPPPAEPEAPPASVPSGAAPPSAPDAEATPEASS